MTTKKRLEFKARAREVIGGCGSYELKESPSPYSSILGHENAVLKPQNEHFWNGSALILK